MTAGGFLAFAAGLCWLGTAALAAGEAPHRPYGSIPKLAVPASGAFEIPVFGDDEKIRLVYLDKKGGLLLAFSFKDHGVLHSDMYDPQAHRRLFPDQSYRAARDNSVEFGYVKAHGLEQLYSMNPASAGKNKEVGQDYIGGRICPNNPYMIVTEISAPKQSRDFRFFHKLAHPLTEAMPADCLTQKLTFRYETVLAGFYANDDGFLAETGRFLIWFDWTGHSPFLDRRSDFVLVPDDAIRPVLNKDREDGTAPGAEAIRKADDLIDRIGQQQRKRSNNG
jgi:hypothetical protein